MEEEVEKRSEFGMASNRERERRVARNKSGDREKWK